MIILNQSFRKVMTHTSSNAAYLWNGIKPLRSVYPNIGTGTNVLYLEAYDAYCYIHYTDGRRDMISKCLKHVLADRRYAAFKRVHRKHAVNPAHVINMRQDASAMTLTNGTMVSIARARKREVGRWYKEKLGNPVN